jgi:hypothetical protein
MPDEKPVTEATELPVETRGKSYRGQKHYPVKTLAEVEAEAKAQVLFNKPGAVSLQTWFAARGHNDVVKRAAMRAYTKINRATLEDWDAIFDKF